MLAVAWNIFLTILAVSLIIIVHEFGHFFCAKAVGMHVEVFSVGFWKKVFGVRIGQTQFQLSLIPFGGYVKVAGESPEEGSGDPGEFWSKTPGQRALFVAGGVAMNAVLALVVFLVAFGIGVPFTVAEVGTVLKDTPAWRAGLKPGDRIVRVNETRNPIFQDLLQAVLLSDRDEVTLQVRRGEQTRTFTITPEQDPEQGRKTLGVTPPATTLVTGLTDIQVPPAVLELNTAGPVTAPVDAAKTVAPARDAGIETGDRILAIEDVAVEYARDVRRQMLKYASHTVHVAVERDGQQMEFPVRTAPLAEAMMGISGLSTRIRALQGNGLAQSMGLKVGDRVVAVDGRPVESAIAIEDGLREASGTARLSVSRDGEELAFMIPAAGPIEVEDFMFSIAFESGTTVRWVRPQGPAWNAGLRPGDTVVSVGGQPVETWEDVVRAGARAGTKPRQIRWVSDGQEFSARITPELYTSGTDGQLGVMLTDQVMETHRYGPVGALEMSARSVWNQVSQTLRMVQGFATREVSPRHMGGIITIGVVSYHAASRGAGRLLWMVGIISTAIAFINILPIPVLDGGHLLFLLIEKVRGRRLSERVMTIAQTVGLVLLLTLVLYVTRNDILRLFNQF